MLGHKQKLLEHVPGCAGARLHVPLSMVCNKATEAIYDVITTALNIQWSLEPDGRGPLPDGN